MKYTDEYLLQWSAKRFYDLVLFLAYESHYQAEYQKLISAKIGK
jgi:hypothetical protein